MLNMSDTEINEIFPKYGDRLAVLDYCGKNKRNQKLSLVERLRLKINKNSKNDTSRSSTFTLDKNDVRINTKRKIELGWLNYNVNEKRYLQVRTKTGGGTRQIVVSKNVDKQYLLNQAKEMFFPNGVSTKGPVYNFTFELFDFKETICESNLTVDEYFKITGLTKLRFYLGSKEKEKCETLTSNSIQLLYSMGDDPYNNQENIIYKDHNTNSFIDISNNTLEVHLFEKEYNTVVEHEVPQTNLVDNIQSTGLEILTSTSYAHSITHTKTLKVHRGCVMEELITEFKIANINEEIIIEMILPNGETEKAFDNGGVFRDCLSEFWNTFYEKCTIGTVMKVPYIRHDFGEKEWIAIARIIKKGWMQEKYFPIKICLPFMECCILGFESTNLVDSFLNFISNSEANVIKKALDDFEAIDGEELVDVLTDMESKWIPSKENLTQLISDIAHRDLIQKPKFIMDCWKRELFNIMDFLNLNHIYEDKKPTAKNILQILTFPDELTAKKIKTISFLKKYLRESDENILGSFLRFSTGSDIITVNKLEVSFYEADGLKRAPLARTCAALLELPYTYDYYAEFRSEFNSVLKSNVWVMDII